MSEEFQTSEYCTWQGMKKRCFNPSHEQFADYGGRGITVCARWRASYRAFLADMGRKPLPELTLDRVNNDGNYEPGNCRWATQKAQANNRRGNVLLTHDGTTRTLTEWAECLGVSPQTLFTRRRKGWSLDRMLQERPNQYQELFTFRGRSKTLGAWAREFGLSHPTLRQRLRQGWSLRRALTTRPDPSRQRPDTIARQGCR